MLRLRSLQPSALACFVLLALLGACASQREPAQQMMQRHRGDARHGVRRCRQVRSRAAHRRADEARRSEDRLQRAGLQGRARARSRAARRGSRAGGDAAAQEGRDRKEPDGTVDIAGRGRACAVHRRANPPRHVEREEEPQDGGRHRPRGGEVRARDATSQWSKAQGAFGNGNMDEAVPTAKDVESRLQALAGTLQAQLPAGLAPPPAS